MWKGGPLHITGQQKKLKFNEKQVRCKTLQNPSGDMVFIWYTLSSILASLGVYFLYFIKDVSKNNLVEGEKEKD